jgi:ribosomal protein S18 acetylase RimI-like enzyme
MFAPAYMGRKMIFFDCFHRRSNRKLSSGCARSFSAQVRWCEPGAPVPTRPGPIGVQVSQNFMDSPVFQVEAASAAQLTELSRLYVAYRVFYGEAPEEERATAFIRERLRQSSGRYFLAWDKGNAIGFMHLMPSTNTLAMRRIWLLEDLYVDVPARGQGVATALLSYAEEFARGTGAERLTLATAHDNLAAQHIYKKLGYVREEHFSYFHRLLPPSVK